MIEQNIISSEKFGSYPQTVFSNLDDAGYISLLSENRFGWGMPGDPATDAYIDSLSGKAVLDIGSGLGDAIVIPALQLVPSVAHVYAMDVTAGHINQHSRMVGVARVLNKDHILSTEQLDESWWDSPLLSEPTVAAIVGHDSERVPKDGAVDRMSARHVLQFGDHNTVLRAFDLASAALAVGGRFFSVNFTPFTQYMFEYDGGATMHRAMQQNKLYAEGLENQPGGYLNKDNGTLKASLHEIFTKEIQDRGDEDRFLLFDIATLEGLMRAWEASRRERGLPVDLFITESYYMSPPKIFSRNKLVGDASFANMENHVFMLEKA